MRMSRQGEGTGRPISILAPVRGWNARDPLAAMDPEFAVNMNNYIPRGNEVVLRRGWAKHATGLPGRVETLLEWAGATRQFFAVSEGAVYDVTAAGPVGAPLLTGLTNSRFQHAMFTTTGGVFLIGVNGADPVLLYNGTTLLGTPTITGVAPEALIDVHAHKSRLWFVEKNTTRARYLAPNAVGGAASQFDLGSVFNEGGTLRTITTVSQDAGDGVDDYLCFISDVGEVAVYRGTDPASVNTWAIVGVFRGGAPIGQRCVVRAAGDANVITEIGVQPLSVLLRSDRTATERTMISDAIRTAFADAVRLGRDEFGWQPVPYPAGQVVVFNVPRPSGTNEQYVMHTQSAAWCRFTGHPALCWSLYDDGLYFGANGYVARADVGTADDGALIPAEVRTAFNYLGTRGTLKRMTMMRAVCRASGVPRPKVRVNADFDERPPVDEPTFEVLGALWGSARWGESLWGGDTAPARSWVSVNAVGRCFSVAWRTESDNVRELAINSFDLIVEPATGAAL